MLRPPLTAIDRKISRKRRWGFNSPLWQFACALLYPSGYGLFTTATPLASLLASAASSASSIGVLRELQFPELRFAPTTLP
jgi:hypothetical protein